MAGKNKNPSGQVGGKHNRLATPHHRHGHVASSRRPVSRTPDFRELRSRKARHETWAARKRHQKESEKLMTSAVEDLLLNGEPKPSYEVLHHRLSDALQQLRTITMPDFTDFFLYRPIYWPDRYTWLHTYSSRSDDSVHTYSSDSISDQWFDVVDSLMDENSIDTPFV